MSKLVLIDGIRISQDPEGRYRLNDLHNAAGDERRHEPANWLKLESTQELIAYEVTKDDTGNPVSIIRGRGIEQGTYVSKKLVYAYASWISPKFYSHVLDVFDQSVNKGKYDLTLEWFDRTFINDGLIPKGYYSIFEVTGHVVKLLIKNGVRDLNDRIHPDQSIGTFWSKEWESRGYDLVDDRIRVPHQYPEWYPQAKRSDIEPWAYPDWSKQECIEWVLETYVKEKLPPYIDGQVKKRKSIRLDEANKALIALGFEPIALKAPKAKRLKNAANLH
jgi:hypothetical protein